jgi:hypothetical protein
VRQEPGRPRARKRRRGGNKTLYYILFTLVLLATAIILSLTVLFEVETVSVAGADKYSPEELARESGIMIGENMFRVDYQGAKDRLLKNYPWLETVELRLRPPHEIHIEVTQSVAAGAVAEGENSVMITRNGKILERGVLFIPDDIPLVTGINTAGTQPGELLGEASADALRMLGYLFDSVEVTGFGMPTNVNLSDIYNMQIVHENRLLLNLGTESELDAKLNFLKNMITEQLPKDAQGVIDAGNVGREVIYVEMPIEDARRGVKHGAVLPEPATAATASDAEAPADAA